MELVKISWSGTREIILPAIEKGGSNSAHADTKTNCNYSFITAFCSRRTATKIKQENYLFHSRWNFRNTGASYYSRWIVRTNPPILYFDVVQTLFNKNLWTSPISVQSISHLFRAQFTALPRILAFLGCQNARRNKFTGYLIYRE